MFILLALINSHVLLQPIVCFMSAACPNLDFKNPTFLGQNNEVLTAANMWF